IFFFSSRRRHTRLQGDWSSDVCSSDLNRDEPDILIHAFNDMLGQIRHRDEALRDAHRELEQRVEARTAELAAANKELGRQNRERSEERRVGKECKLRRWQ